MYNGWTPTIPEHERLTNEIETLKKFLEQDPQNAYYRNRIEALEGQRLLENITLDAQADYFAALKQTGEAEQVASEAQEIDNWLQSDNAAPLYGDATIDRFNNRAGYNLFGAMATMSPERIAWEQKYLAKRKAHIEKYWSKRS